jgi:CHAT domain-containing protein
MKLPVIMRCLIILSLLSAHVLCHAQRSKGDIYYEQATLQTEKGDARKAIKGFLSARAEYLKEKNYYWVLVSTQNVAMYHQDTGDGKAAEKLIMETIREIPRQTSEQLSIVASLYDNLAYTYLYLLNRVEDALAAYNEALSLYEKAGKSNTPDYAFELVNRATTYHELSKFQAAVDDMLKAIAIYEKDKDTTPESLAEYYRTLASSYLQLEEFDLALTSFQQGYALIQHSDNAPLKAKFLNDIGIIHHRKEQYTQAMDNFNQAKKINEAEFGKDPENYAKNIINIGMVYHAMGDLEASFAHYQEALAIYQTSPPKSINDMIDLLLNIKIISDEAGKFEESKTLLQQAMSLATTTGANSFEVADVYLSMAATALNHGEFDESLQYNFKTLSILDANDYPQNTTYAVIYSNIALAYDELNDRELALQYNRKALEIYRKIFGTHHHTIAMATSNIGLSYEAAGDYDEALTYLQQALAIRLQIQSPTHEDVGTVYLNMGLIHLKKHETKSAIGYLEKARVIYDHYSKNKNKAMIYNRLGVAYFVMKDYANAARCLQQAIVANTYNFSNLNFDTFPDQPDFIDYFEIILTYTAKSDWYVQQGDLNSLLKAVRQLDAADKILKEKAINLGNAKDRLELAQVNALFTEAGLTLTSKLFQVTKDPAYLEKAFYYSERSKANELNADIQSSKAASLSRIPKRLTDRKRDLTIRMNTLQTQIAAAYTTQNQSLMTRLKAQEFDLTREYQNLQADILKAAPSLSSVIDSRSLASWSEVKKLLDANTAMISYTITDSSKFILIGNQKKLVLKEIDKHADLDRLVRGFTNQVKFQGPVLNEMIQQLTEVLWAPVEPVLAELGDIKKVVIIPEGPLNYLPFEVLGKNGYLIENYSVQYHVSGALFLAAETNKTERTRPSFIALAPVFEDKETSFLNKSCERFVSSAQKADTATRAFSLNGQYIAPLPATETEVEKINQIHSDNGIISRYFVREAANEELIKKGELAGYDFIHFATHGFVNSQYPELSGLLLAQNPRSAEDGVLYSGEILSLTLKAELVTLSACETALGKKIEGEGVRGLTTAFLFAGARSVVASLWKVADESTSLLMISFYSELLSGKDKASALRQAKRNLISTGKFSNPYYWAPFIQIGGN